MATAVEDLRILQSAEGCADKIWKQVVQWDEFAKEVVGKQMARATDSIGANIAESFGRYNFGEKLQFLYYARGSLFETKYWLNRAKMRDLMSTHEVAEHISRLTEIAKQLNSFAESLRHQRSGNKSVREPSAEYQVDIEGDDPKPLFDDSDLIWIQS